MKKFLWVILLALLSFFMIMGISQAGQCIYLLSSEGKNYYYDPSGVQYSGDIVSFFLYDNDACEVKLSTITSIEIDCAKRMIFDLWGDEGWKSISPGSIEDTLRIKFCR